MSRNKSFAKCLIYEITATALSDDGITTAAAGPIRCPLLNSFCRHLDPIG